MNRSGLISLSSPDRSGLCVLTVETGDQVEWRNDYRIAMDHQDAQLLLALDTSSKRFDILNYDFSVIWSFTWRTFSVSASSFRDQRGAISSIDGKLGLIDFQNQNTTILDITSWCTSISCISLSSDGTLIAVASEYGGSENSALVLLSSNGDLMRHLRLFAPEHGAAFIEDGRFLIKTDGEILEPSSGDVVRTIAW